MPNAPDLPPQIRAAQRDTSLAIGLACAGSFAALVTLWFVRSLAAAGYSWAYARGEWVGAIAMTALTVAILSGSLRFAWRVRQRAGVVPGATWWALGVLVALAVMLLRTVVAGA